MKNPCWIHSTGRNLQASASDMLIVVFHDPPPIRQPNLNLANAFAIIERYTLQPGRLLAKNCNAKFHCLFFKFLKNFFLFLADSKSPTHRPGPAAWRIMLPGRREPDKPDECYSPSRSDNSLIYLFISLWLLPGMCAQINQSPLF